MKSYHVHKVPDAACPAAYATTIPFCLRGLRSKIDPSSPNNLIASESLIWKLKCPTINRSSFENKW